MPMRILFASSEVWPFSKTGGLADVAGSLPQALARLGHEVLVVSPWYSGLKRAEPFWIGDIEVPFSGFFEPAGVGTWEQDGVRYAFVGHDFFRRDSLYGYDDDAARFSLFSRALPQVASRLSFTPDVIHLNDWHTATVALVLERGWHLPPGFAYLPSVFTVHNAQFQGEATLAEMAWWLRLPDSIDRTWLNRFGRANAMQAALGTATRVTTVSPTYSREIQTPGFGFGLDASFRSISHKLSGILNGIDQTAWDPQTDAALPVNFGPESVHKGKAAARSLLCSRHGLDPARPIVAAISRLADQKGMDILVDAAPELSRLGLSLFVLGSGDPGLERRLADLAGQDPNIAVVLGYDDPLSRLVYAASDLLCMPSRFEPCGLNQMIAMRYGSLPLVRATGGLKDTVRHLGNGFTFEDASVDDLVRAAREAVSTYGTDKWALMQETALGEDHSWERSARQYERLYSGIVSG